MSRETLIERQFSDGSKDFGNGVIGPSHADIFAANNAEGSLPFRPTITKASILEVGALGAVAVTTVACSAEKPVQTGTPVITIAPETSSPTANPTSDTGNVFSPEPTTSAEPTAEPTPTAEPNPYGENRTEIFEIIKTQDKKDIENTSLKEYETASRKLINPKYAEAVAQYPVTTSDYFTKELVDNIFDAMKGKDEGFKNFMNGYTSRKEALKDYQMLVTGSFIAMLLAVCSASDDPEIQKLALEAADKAWEYGIKIDVGGAKDELNFYVQDQINFHPDW